MDQSIASPGFGVLNERSRENALTARRESHIDWIVHSADHNRLSKGAARPASEDMRGTRHQRGFAFAGMCLFPEGTLAPIDPSIQPQIRSMQVVRAIGQRLALKPFLTLVRDA